MFDDDSMMLDESVAAPTGPIGTTEPAQETKGDVQVDEFGLPQLPN